MYFEDYDKTGSRERNGDDIYSKPIRAGKRTYFFDVKSTRNNDYYLTITESKRRVEKDGRFVYDKHKIFLYKEDFDKFIEGVEETINFIKEKNPSTQNEREREREEEIDVTKSFSDVNFEEL